MLVPESYRAGTRAPLILCLHGAGSSGHDAIQPFRRPADDHGILLLAPDSRDLTWDATKGNFGADVEFIDLALQAAFDGRSVDPGRVAIAGFSDGGSYALALGLANGELFTHIIAFSPGTLRSTTREGKPRVFISHGSNDLILPSVRCSRRIVSRLEREDYDVRFTEFTGEHAVPADISQAAVEWFLG